MHYWDFTRNMSIEQAQQFRAETKGMTLNEIINLLKIKNNGSTNNKRIVNSQA